MAHSNEMSAFLQLFADRHQTYVRSRNAATWRTTSQWHYLSDEELLSSLQRDSSVRRAFGVMEKTNFLVIQIDGTKSPTAFHTTKNLQKQLKEIGLLPKTFYIDELEVWQIFVFFAESVSTKRAITLATTWLKSNWFDLDTEAVSLLPSGAPLQIPVQASFTWLNDELVRVVSASEISSENAISMFMQDLRTNKVTFEAFENALLQAQVVFPIKHEFVEPVFNLTSSKLAVQTVETNEREANMDFSPPEAVTDMAGKRGGDISLLEAKESVQTEAKDLEITLLPPIAEHKDNQEIILGPEFEELVQCDRSVQADKPHETTGPSGNSLSELRVLEQAESILIETREKSLHELEEDIQCQVIDKNLLQPAHQEPVFEAVQVGSEQKTKDYSVVLETPIDSVEPRVQTLSFIREHPNECPPGQSETAHSGKSLVRKSSSRDGPEKRRNSVRASQTADADSDSFEQLTLQFGTNTS